MAFKNQYAEFYNLLYREKDYQSEAFFIHQLIQKNQATGPTDNVRVLDLACGTGKHAFELEKLGYTIDGSDISADMVSIAHETAKEVESNCEFFNHSFQNSNQIDKTYDVVISMFSAINYLTSYEDLKKTLQNIRGLLKEGGILIFDYWNGNAVTRDYSPLKVLRKADEKGELMRISKTSLDLFKQIATVEFTCLYFEQGSKQIEFSETHLMRYFYFKELESFLKINGFEIANQSAFMSLESNLDPFEWNVSVVAKKIKDEN